jgi:predicted dehydrogenase
VTSDSTTIGLVGCGAWGSQLFNEFTSLGAQLVCYPGRTEASRERARSLVNCQVVGDVDELLFDPAVDAIAIATPPESHAALAQRALAAGKHAFVEKPLAFDMEELQRVLGLAHERNLVLFTGYTVSFHPVVQQLARLSAEGRLRSMSSYKGKIGTFASDLVTTLLVHDLAVADAITGGLDEWSICAMSGPDSNPDVVSLIFESASGAHGLIHVDRVSPNARRELSVWIDDRLYRWNGGCELYEFVSGEYREVYSSSVSALEAELRVFLDAVIAGEPDSDELERERRLAELTIRIREEVVA